jgi:hypothetical protein
MVRSSGSLSTAILASVAIDTVDQVEGGRSSALRVEPRSDSIGSAGPCNLCASCIIHTPILAVESGQDDYTQIDSSGVASEAGWCTKHMDAGPKYS